MTYDSWWMAKCDGLVSENSDLRRELDRLRTERNALLAIARRVHAECGPELDDEGLWECKCWSRHRDKNQINHDPDCLWLAADAALKKAGII